MTHPKKKPIKIRAEGRKARQKAKQTQADHHKYDGSIPLTNGQHERFCQALCEDIGANQTKAAIRAGYAETNARGTASYLLTHPHIQARLTWLKSQAADDAIMTRREALIALSRAARQELCGNMADYMTAGIDGTNYLEFGEEMKNPMAVKRMKTKTFADNKGNGSTIVSEMELHPRTQSVELLARIQGWMKSDENDTVRTRTLAEAFERSNSQPLLPAHAVAAGIKTSTTT